MLLGLTRNLLLPNVSSSLPIDVGQSWTGMQMIVGRDGGDCSARDGAADDEEYSV